MYLNPTKSSKTADNATANNLQPTPTANRHKAAKHDKLRGEYEKSKKTFEQYDFCPPYVCWEKMQPHHLSAAFNARVIPSEDPLPVPHQRCQVAPSLLVPRPAWREQACDDVQRPPLELLQTLRTASDDADGGRTVSGEAPAASPRRMVLRRHLSGSQHQLSASTSPEPRANGEEGPRATPALCT